MYAHHLDRWLLYFPPQQISIIDGEQVRLDPVTSMTKLQHFLKIRPIFDYSLHLRYGYKSKKHSVFRINMHKKILCSDTMPAKAFFAK